MPQHKKKTERTPEDRFESITDVQKVLKSGKDLLNVLGMCVASSTLDATVPATQCPTPKQIKKLRKKLMDNDIYNAISEFSESSSIPAKVLLAPFNTPILDGYTDDENIQVGLDILSDIISEFKVVRLRTRGASTAQRMREEEQGIFTEEEPATRETQCADSVFQVFSATVMHHLKQLEKHIKTPGRGAGMTSTTIGDEPAALGIIKENGQYMQNFESLDKHLDTLAACNRRAQVPGVPPTPSQFDHIFENYLASHPAITRQLYEGSEATVERRVQLFKDNMHGFLTSLEQFLIAPPHNMAITNADTLSAVVHSGTGKDVIHYGKTGRVKQKVELPEVQFKAQEAQLALRGLPAGTIIPKAQLTPEPQHKPPVKPVPKPVARVNPRVNVGMDGWIIKQRKDSASGQVRPAFVYYENGVEKSQRWADTPLSNRKSKFPPIPPELLRQAGLVPRR
jgi:hypothetical protein